MKRVYDTRTFFHFLKDALSNLGDMRTAAANGVDRQFGERIMLAVTEVNGCRYCSYYHTRLALEVGVPQAEIDELAQGDLADAPQEQQIALMFAQHYAEKAGQPDQQAVQWLEATYGPAKAGAITAYIRMIMIGNTYGNSFDALRHRLKGKPAAGSTLGQELGVLAGVVFMIPWIMFGQLFKRKTRKDA
jgi:AhpD family alkylhydroperoxidase